MCKLLVKHCEEGFSVESFAAVIDVTPEVFPIWARQHVDFEIAMHVAYWKSYRTIENRGMAGLIAPKTYELIMRNRFNWKQDTEETIRAIAKMDRAQLEELARRIISGDSPKQVIRAKEILDGDYKVQDKGNDQG